MPMTDRGETEDAFQAQLVEHGLIVPVGVPGIFGRGAVFEDVLQAIDRSISLMSKDDGAFRVHFPPVVARDVFEKSEFMDSFPQLTGTVFSFTGTDAQHKELQERIHQGREWSDLQSMTDVVLTPAACYPIYPSLSGKLPVGGRTVDMWSYCYRHEPSGDPARMQMFRVREFVRAGEQHEVLTWREMWMKRGLDLLDRLRSRGQGRSRSGSLLRPRWPLARGESTRAGAQVRGGRPHLLHREADRGLLVQLPPGALHPPLRDSRQQRWLAQTACLGFGLERIVMAHFKKHGFETETWPAAVRHKLWP